MAKIFSAASDLRPSRRRFVQGAGALLSLTATGFSVARAVAQQPQRGGHLRLGLAGGGSADVLDPALATSFLDMAVANSWGDTLIETDPETGAPMASLAESWSPSEDAKVWTFKIRQGVSFHNGDPMTVADVVASLRRHVGEGSQSGALGLLRSIERIEEIAGDLVITSAEGNADLPLLLSDYHLQIQPNGGVDEPNAAVGTGPYKLVQFAPGIRSTFEKNQNDWRDDRGFVDSFEIIVMNDATARVSALMSGQVHFINDLPPRTVDQLQNAPNIEILQTSGKGFYCYLMHCDTPPFDNNDLRMALKLAVDREAILQQVLGGFGTLGNDYPVNENYAFAPTDIEQRVYDPDQAAYYYQKSGYDQPILLRTSEAAFPGAIDAALLFQQSAGQAGIPIEVSREPSDGYWSEVWNVQPFCVSDWGGRPTQDARYSTSFVSDAEWNDTRFKRPEFDQLVYQARAELDEEQRRALYRKMAIMVRDEGGLILPVFNDFLNAASSNMKGFVHDIGNDLSNGRIASRVWLES